MLQDLLAAFAVCLAMSAGAVLVSGYMVQPTPDNRCPHCGEYVDDAEAARDHLARCQPCR